jgi:hypothetical protein
MIDQSPQSQVDLREALYNDRAVGPVTQIALPREAVTKLHGLVVDLDANVLKDNPWFPPAATAEEFLAAVQPVLNRHPILRNAEIRFTGRWLHAIIMFREPVELRSAADQNRWNGIHRVLKASVPSDPAAPSLIAMTRPVGSINSKTGFAVNTLKPGEPIDAVLLQDWIAEVRNKPFETVALILFGQRRVSPCPYCLSEGSYLDLGELMGFCYGPCRRVRIKRLSEPFMFDGSIKGGAVTGNVEESARPTQNKKEV